MLQEFNQNRQINRSAVNVELNWWRTWTSSWWANVYF
ncbi:Trp operon leader peptide [Vibrio sp.]